MADTTLVPDENDQDDPIEDDPIEDDPGEGDSPETDEDAEASDADKEGDEAGDEEIEIVHTGDAGSQPDGENLEIRRRVRGLKAERKAAQDKANQSNELVVHLQEEVRLLKLSSELNETDDPKLPDPNDFDDGQSDPKYREAFNAYHQKTVEKLVKEHIPEPVPKDTWRQDQELERVKTKHYGRAEKLGVADFAKAEDITVGILGEENVNAIMAFTEHSDKIVYHLGKNPEKAHYFADLSRTNPSRAIAEIGALGVELKPQPKARAKPAPDPDEELEGQTPSRSSSNAKRGPKGATYS